MPTVVRECITHTHNNGLVLVAISIYHTGYLKDKGRTFRTREEAEVELQRLSALGYRERGYDSMSDGDLKVRFCS